MITNPSLDLTRHERSNAKTMPLPRLRFEPPADLHTRLAPPVASTFDGARLVRSLRARVVLS